MKDGLARLPHALDLPSRRRLFESVASRGSTEVAALVIPGLLVWAHGQSASPLALVAWWAAFIVFAGALFALRRAFRADIAAMGDRAVERWQPVFAWLALANGVGWTVPIFLTLHDGSYEFKLLLYLALCGVIASAASFLATAPGMFVRFFIGCWVPLVVAVYWVFPARWPFILPLTLLYGVLICRHAWGTRHFTLQQFALERERAALAEQYRIARDRAEQALAEKDRFLSTASHDLRQPVHAMGMLVDAALSRNTDTELTPLLHDVQRCTRSLTGMFDALLDLSRIEAGTFAAAHTAVAVRDLFADVATVFAPDAAARGLQLRFRLPHRGEAVVDGDPTLLRQIAFNLTQNAMRYTPRGGVLLGVRRRGGRWRFEVWDTGSGVAPEDRSRIYSPFYRGQSGALATRGHGLGLAVVARCAELMDSGYGFESTPGRGSCFWVELPRSSRNADTPSAAAPSRRGTLAGRCLLVDDDPQVATAAATLMQTWGLNTRVAHTAQEALAHVDGGFAPDAIFCDLRLGAGHTGFDLLQRLLARCPDARGAMVSGEAGAPELVQAEEDGYLVFGKPLEPDVLHAVLSRWLAAANA